MNEFGLSGEEEIPDAPLEQLGRARDLGHRLLSPRKPQRIDLWHFHPESKIACLSLPGDKVSES